MLEKASLTLVTNDHKLRNNKKLGEEKNIADLDQKLKDIQIRIGLQNQRA